MDNRQWREFMDAAMGVPPGRVTVAAVRRRLVRRRIREAAGVLAAVVVAVVGVTAAVQVFGAAPGPAAGHRPTVPATAYVTNGVPLPARGEPRPAWSTVTRINTATNTAGKPIKVGPVGSFPDFIAITPDRKTAYVANHNSGSVTPINTATNTAGNPIRTGRNPIGIAITPDGKTAYVASLFGTVTPINTATNRPGNPIHVGGGPGFIAITPDGKTAYVVNQYSFTVTPINTATNRPGKPIKVAATPSLAIAITP
jgi:YVTN family beta-propeller protein